MIGAIKIPQLPIDDFNWYSDGLKLRMRAGFPKILFLELRMRGKMAALRMFPLPNCVFVASILSVTLRMYTIQLECVQSMFCKIICFLEPSTHSKCQSVTIFAANTHIYNYIYILYISDIYVRLFMRTINFRIYIYLYICCKYTHITIYIVNFHESWIALCVCFLNGIWKGKSNYSITFNYKNVKI